MEAREHEARREDAPYDFSLKGPGFSVGRKVTEEIAREIIGIIMGGGDMREGPATGRRRRQPPSGTGRSLREYLDGVGAKKNPQIITAIGQYLEDTTGEDNFSRDDIRSGFRKAGEPLPANLSRDVRLTIATGWIADAGPRYTYFVTNAGREALESSFSGLKIRRSARRRTRKAGGWTGDEPE
jgi:hypothetical protein